MVAKRKLQQSIQPTKRFFHTFPYSEGTAFLAFVGNGNPPESYPNLDLGPISKNVDFEKIEGFSIQRKSRCGGDLLPCAMCSPNKFLHGALIWIPESKSIAIIGNCCANPANQAQADFEYNKRKEFRAAETYLLENIPLVKIRMDSLKFANEIAFEQEKVHKALKRNFPVLHKELTAAKKENCELYHIENINNSYSSTGPTKGGLTTAKISLGRFVGETAVLASFRPSQKLKIVENTLGLFAQYSNEELACEFVLTLTYEQLIFTENLLREAAKSYDKISKTLIDFALFFNLKNIQTLDNWRGQDGNSFEIRLNNNSSRMIGSDGGTFSSMEILPIILSVLPT